MNRALQPILLVAVAVLLVGILVVLVQLAHRGVRIEHAGTVELSGLQDTIRLQMGEPITLQMPDPAYLVATGAQDDEIPVRVALPRCSACGASMLPVRWNLWTGQIEWACPTCGEPPTAAPRRGE
jgi:hypothetical protein